mmetsp:Transcript_3151/g.4773  ORF Transcript_3151/g.4773 Transcript_3151/m.4773 type:complete len:161 (-) Transcript_3151:69-551(-)
MKVVALFVSLFVCAQAFSPMVSNVRSSTSLNESLFTRIAKMDLFAPVKDQNDYGARKKKNVKVGKLTDKSYIPAGLSKAQYEKVRQQEAAKKAANYERNVKKAGIFTDYTDWYKERGTDKNSEWKKSVTLGHRMAKTKYDWQGNEQTKFTVWAKKADKKK